MWNAMFRTMALCRCVVPAIEYTRPATNSCFLGALFSQARYSSRLKGPRSGRGSRMLHHTLGAPSPARVVVSRELDGAIVFLSRSNDRGLEQCRRPPVTHPP